MIKTLIANRAVAAVYVLCAATTLFAEIDADDAARPPAAGSPPVVIQSGGGAERAAYIIAYTGGAAYFLTVMGGKLIDLLATGRRRWHEAEAGTDHQRWTDCEEHRRQDAETIKRKDGELTTAWSLSGQKDTQIRQLSDQVNRLLEVNEALTHTIGANNRNLIDRIPSPGSGPIPVIIDQANVPIPVHPVDAEGGDA